MVFGKPFSCSSLGLWCGFVCVFHLFSLFILGGVVLSVPLVGTLCIPGSGAQPQPLHPLCGSSSLLRSIACVSCGLLTQPRVKKRLAGVRSGAFSLKYVTRLTKSLYRYIFSKWHLFAF